MTRSRMQKSSWCKGRLCAWTESLRKPTKPIAPSAAPESLQPAIHLFFLLDIKEVCFDSLLKNSEFVHLAKFEHAVCHSCGRYRPLSRRSGNYRQSPQCFVFSGFLCFLVCGFFWVGWWFLV